MRETFKYAGKTVKVKTRLIAAITLLAVMSALLTGCTENNFL